METIFSAILATIGTIGAAYLLYLGGKRTASASREGSAQSARVDEQQSALTAWRDLNQPLRDEVTRLSNRLTEVLAEQTRERLERNAHDADVQNQLTRQAERVDLLTVEVKHWKSLAKAIARWATNLRDQVIALGGSAPTIPEELALAQLIPDDDLDGH